MYREKKTVVGEMCVVCPLTALPTTTTTTTSHHQSKLRFPFYADN
jgi:hypothetical protein